MNRSLTQFSYSFEKKKIDIFLTADGGGAGNNMVLLNDAGVAASAAGYKGVKSITRNADGDYTITLQGKFTRLLAVDAKVLSKDGATAPLANSSWVKAATPSAGTIELVTYLATIGTPVAPGTNDRWMIHLTVSDSTAQ